VTPDIFFLPDSEAVGLRAASIFAGLAKSSLAARGRFSAALSGGTTPLKMFGQLAAGFGRDIRWDLTDIFWADERCVPPFREDSNYRGAHVALLSRLDIPPANIHRIRGEMPPEEGATEYEKELRRFFGDQGLPVFDLIILGVGEDGHTASLFPDELSLAESRRLAIPVYVGSLKSWRITLTMPVLNNATEILFLATGPKKSRILRELLGGGNSRNYPAGLIQPVHGNVTWLVDEEAAFLLQRT
jgi:6-phosphogluconolactonase